VTRTSRAFRNSLRKSVEKPARISETHSRARARAPIQRPVKLCASSRKKSKCRVTQINLRANSRVSWSRGRDTRVTVESIDSTWSPSSLSRANTSCDWNIRFRSGLGSSVFPLRPFPRCIIVANAARRELVIAVAAAIMQGAEGNGIRKRAWKWKSRGMIKLLPRRRGHGRFAVYRYDTQPIIDASTLS